MNLTKPEHKARKSFDLLSDYNHFLPDFKQSAFLLLFLLLGAVLGNLLILGMGTFLPEEAISNYAMLISYPVMFIPAMIYAKSRSRFNAAFDMVEECPVDRSGFGRFNGWTLGLMVVITTLAANFATDPLMKLLPPMPEWFKGMMENMLVGIPLWATLLSVSVFAPFFEEWLCRGMILRGLLKRTSPAVAMLTSALIFALIHMNPWQALPAFLLGMLFAYVYYRTGSLKLTMLMHCANNTFAALMGQVDALREVESFSEILDGWQYVVLTCTCVFIIVVFIDLLRKGTPQPDHSSEENSR